MRSLHNHIIVKIHDVCVLKVLGIVEMCWYMGITHFLKALLINFTRLAEF
jgi:hypothetical protein